jgi:hypothetical protein
MSSSGRTRNYRSRAPAEMLSYGNVAFVAETRPTRFLNIRFL